MRHATGDISARCANSDGARLSYGNVRLRKSTHWRSWAVESRLFLSSEVVRQLPRGSSHNLGAFLANARLGRPVAVKLSVADFAGFITAPRLGRQRLETFRPAAPARRKTHPGEDPDTMSVRTTDNSPPFQRWGSRRKNEQVPSGTTESIQHSFLIVQPVLLQKRDKFFFERSGSMMLRLGLDVFDCVIHARNPDAECSVPLLP
jgi:hypothetical protein